MYLQCKSEKNQTTILHDVWGKRKWINSTYTHHVYKVGMDDKRKLKWFEIPSVMGTRVQALTTNLTTTTTTITTTSLVWKALK